MYIGVNTGNYLFSNSLSIPMDPIFKKLNYKGHPEIIVLNAPESFQPHLKAIEYGVQLYNSLDQPNEIHFIIAFVTQQHEINGLVPVIATKMEGDALVWFAYPKKSSKNYTCDVNRDTGWDIMGKFGLEPVRQIAIDQDWSALRFRKVEFIKKITRSKKMALTEEAKKRTTNKDK